MRWQFFCQLSICAGLLLSIASTVESQDVSSGKSDPNLAGFDRLMSSFIREHGLPGAELAVSHNGRIVYNRGFGYGDRDAKTPVEPTSLFRIGSISKALTATAVLQLVEANKLRLADTVFDVLKLQKPQAGPFDERWRLITVLELLQHTGGWDSAKSFDPTGPWQFISKEMNLKTPGDHTDIIQYMLRQPLQFDPGTQHHYSNFGYCLLGRLIEKISGEWYETYVQTHVLAPLGIRRMHLGKTPLKSRGEHEVKYYATDSEDPYASWYLETLDSAGAWVGTAEDVLQFALAFEKPKLCKILKEASITTMFARPAGPPGQDKDGKPLDVYYGCGWNVHSLGGGRMSTWHLGALPGTSAEVARLGNGVTFVVLFNARHTSDKKPAAGVIEGKLGEAADAVKRWPR